jgi:hypothetical protein
MAWTIRDDLRLTTKMGLTRGLTLVHGMRRQLSEEERNRIAAVIVDQVLRSNYRIEVGEPMSATGKT